MPRKAKPKEKTVEEMFLEDRREILIQNLKNCDGDMEVMLADVKDPAMSRLLEGMYRLILSGIDPEQACRSASNVVAKAYAAEAAEFGRVDESDAI